MGNTHVACPSPHEHGQRGHDVHTRLVGIRKQERKKIVLPCVVHHFTGTGTKMGVVRAATRNISTGGIGLLVDRPMARGEAVEVVLDRHASKHFFAGLVSFCRRIDGTMHEVGVQFVLHSVTSIISEDPSEALRTYDWVAQALSAKQNGGLEPQVCS